MREVLRRIGNVLMTGVGAVVILFGAGWTLDNWRHLFATSPNGFDGEDYAAMVLYSMPLIVAIAIVWYVAAGIKRKN